MLKCRVSHTFFDWSGTLSNDPVVILAANNRMFEQKGLIPLTLAEWRPRTRLNAAQYMRDHGIEGSDGELLSWYQRELENVKADGIYPSPYPDTAQLLSCLKTKGFGIAVLSTHPINHLREESNQYEVAGLIDLFIGDSPNKTDGLRTLMKRYGITNPQQALYVGDTVYDIQHAKEAGVVSVAVCEGFHDRARLTAENPNFIFDDLQRMLEAIKSGQISLL